MGKKYSPGDFVDSKWRPPGEPRSFQKVVTRKDYESCCDSAKVTKLDDKENLVYIEFPDRRVDFFNSEYNSPDVFTKEEATQNLRDYIRQAEENLHCLKEM
jgi:hypothetical protein